MTPERLREKLLAARLPIEVVDILIRIRQELQEDMLETIHAREIKHLTTSQHVEGADLQAKHLAVALALNEIRAELRERWEK